MDVLGNIPGGYSTSVRWEIRTSNVILHVYVVLLPLLFLRLHINRLFVILLSLCAVHVSAISIYKFWGGISNLLIANSGIEEEPWSVTVERFAANSWGLIYCVLFLFLLSLSRPKIKNH